MRRLLFGSSVLILAMVGLPVGNPVAAQSLTKCTAVPKPLTLAKPRSGVQKTSGTVPARSTIEYNVTTLKSDAKVEVKLTGSALKYEIYALEPSTRITKIVNWWEGTLYSRMKYAIVINNCTGKVKSSYKLEITWRGN